MNEFLVYQQGPTGAELGTLGHMATIRLKKKIPGVPAGANRGRIRDTGTYGNHQTKKKVPGVPAGANRGRIRDTWTYENH